MSEITTNMSVEALCELAANPTISVPQMKQLSLRDEDEIRVALTENPNLHHSIVFALTDDTNKNVVSGAYNHPNAKMDTLDKVAEDYRRTILEHCANHLNRSKKFTETLANHDAYYIRQIIAKNKTTPSELLHHIAVNETTAAVVEQIAWNPKTSAKTLTYLSDSASFEIRKTIAMHKNTSAEIIHKYVFDNHVEVRANAYMNQHFPAQLAPKMVENETELAGFKSLMRIKGLPDEHYLNVLEKVPYYGKNEILGVLASNPTIGALVVEKIMSSTDDPKVTAIVAENPNTPKHIINQIFVKAKDRFGPHKIYLKGLAWNETLPHKIVGQIFEHCTKMVYNTETQQIEGENPEKDSLDVFGNADYQYEEVLVGLAQNPQCPLVITKYVLDNIAGKYNKENLVYRVIKNDATYKDWPVDWVEEHFGVKLYNLHRNMDLFQREGN